MERMDHLEHLDKHLVDELAQVARETIREEVREQTRKQRRTAVLYASSGALALYAGAALSLAVGLALSLVLPDWAAALITAGVLGVLAYLLRGAARPHGHRSGPDGAGLAAPPVGTPAGGLGMSVPPMPSTPPDVPRQGGAGSDLPNPRV
ncbi:phage holin family protein [Streptomyces sp. NPDC006172]|uniref:phage holin family protein n=1 Tax=Streptomyces sp. NPDC006172 TaxID=3154470 RepID=UPI0033D27429